jgi:hypothetical protein
MMTADQRKPGGASRSEAITSHALALYIATQVSFLQASIGIAASRYLCIRPWVILYIGSLIVLYRKFTGFRFMNFWGINPSLFQ